jgi:hypothetical protein
MSDTPQVVGLLLCERVLQDVIRRDAVSCINIHNGITAQSFPAIIPLVYAFAQVKGVEEEFSYQFKFVNALNRVIAESPVAKVDPLPNRYMTQKLISAFTGITFESEGMFNMVLEIEGEVQASLPFQVVKTAVEEPALEFKA